MKILMIFAAVLLITEAAKVPQLSSNDVIHRVTVEVPINVLAASPETLPAVVVEVSKDHVHKPDMPVVMEQPVKEEMITIQPEPDTTTPHEEKEKVTTVKVPLETDKIVRKTRAVPFGDYRPSNQQPKLSTDMNVIKSILTQRKSNWNNTPHRSMRSIIKENVSELPTTTDMPVMDMSSTMRAIKMSTINPCDLLCTKFEFIPVCATNGLCLHEFPNQCILDTYNCKNPHKKFSATKDDRCQMHWLTKCEEGDYF